MTTVKLKKQELLQKINIPGTCIIGQGLAFGGTRWILYVGKQRKYGELIDGRTVNGFLKNSLIKENQNGEFTKFF